MTAGRSGLGDGGGRRRGRAVATLGVVVEDGVVLVDVGAPGEFLGDRYLPNGWGPHAGAGRRRGTHGPIAASIGGDGVGSHRLGLRAGELRGPGNIVRLIHFLCAGDEGALTGVFGLLATLGATAHPKEEKSDEENSVGNP